MCPTVRYPSKDKVTYASYVVLTLTHIGHLGDLHNICVYYLIVLKFGEEVDILVS